MPSKTDDVDRINNYYEYVTISYNDMNRSKWELIGGFRGFAVFMQKSDHVGGNCTFRLVQMNSDWRNEHSNHRVVMHLQTDIEDNGNYVAFSYLCKKYRGKGIAAGFYHYLITKHNVHLISGCEQSRGGESIWKKLSEFKDVRIKIVDSSDYKIKERKSVKYDSALQAWNGKIKTEDNQDYCLKATKVQRRKKPELLAA